MELFKIIDRKTGKEPTDRVITAQARSGNLIPCDIDGFYVGEDGQIILVDDCGNCTWLDMRRFKVESHNEVERIRAEVEDINPWALAFAPSEYKDTRPKIVARVISHVLEIIDKYKEDT